MDPTPAGSDDNWPPESVGPEKHLHALGVISAYYNLYEETLQFLFGYHIERPDVAEFLFRRQNNAERLATIRFSFNQHEKDPNVLDHIEYLITHYSICHDNRNILMHSR